MKNYPKISIVTPNFNLGKYLEKTIMSVISQDYPNLEYIIIDGGSSDNSVEIIKKYSDKLYFWISEKDFGMYDAINKGFEKSTGDIMMWINSDDLLHYGAFQNIAEVFTKFPEVEWITGINTSFDEKDRVIHAFQAEKKSKYDLLRKEFMWIQQETTVWKRSLWIKSGGYVNKNARLAGDLELWLRFSMFAKMYPCNLLIGGFRLRTNGQLTSNMKEYMNEAFFFIDCFIPDKKTYSKKILIDLLSYIKLAIHYSLILDIRIITLILNKIIYKFHEYPYRIVVHTSTGELRLENRK